MKKCFKYTRISNSGKPYEVDFTIEVSPSGFAKIEATFSLREVLKSRLADVLSFMQNAMKEYQLGVAEFGNRVNHGHPTGPINRGGVYYSIDGKLYRCDKHISGSWKAPASDLLRIVVALANDEENYLGGLTLPR